MESHITRRVASIALALASSIALADTPSVVIANSPSRPVPVAGNVTVGGNVAITNTAANPVPTLDVKNPLQLNYSGVIDTRPAWWTTNSNQVVATVPAGQLWVVEHVSVSFGAAQVAGDNASAWIRTPQVSDVIPVTQNNWPQSYEYVGSVQTKIYVMPGETLTLGVEVCCSTQPGNNGVGATITGYWVPYK
jgi:hypothetical protein